MLSLIFVALAATREAKMDRLFEVYKLNLINRRLISEQGSEVQNRNWNSYNPLASNKGPWGIKRDGWHWNKALMYLFLFSSHLAFGLEAILLYCLLSGWYIPIIFILGSLPFLVRAKVFESSLIKYRKKITAENNLILQ